MIRDENYFLLKKNSGDYFKLIPDGSIYLNEMIVFLPGQLKNVWSCALKYAKKKRSSHETFGWDPAVPQFEMLRSFRKIQV